MGYGRRVPAADLDEDIGGLVDSRAVTDTKREWCGVVTGVGDIARSPWPWTAIEEVVWGATETGAGSRDGPDDRLDGAVASFAISRPSSPTRPWSSERSPLRSWRS